ncbi:pseudaminic acid cytidylyltransferase [Maribacter polysaccharolyticus]|uniref:pseudaminic acid cytidylyltransferase n=1 Tax=Maribacter polysaccharolyticus TaxID=3020831 RepID=UPI00237F09AB|nr:pseudaminic acid cytidylyltransferase [Maribacter polysaccharolyticus]MDE3742215.1 pseudaminic acid cytidylyltransferase [Maribacter polysaccharolyticus]
MANLAIIPARGGSKRIPRKNIKFFLGKPIIAYSIEAALKSELFEEVMVSTDDEEIAKIASDYGAKVPFLRTDKNSDDFATTVEVITEVIENYKKIDKTFDYICCIYPTAPFVTIQKLTNSLKILKKNSLDTVLPVIQYSFPVQRAMRAFQKNLIRMIQPEYINTRSQDLEPTYHDAGQFYWMRTEKIVAQKKLWTDCTGFIEISEIEAQDIDTVTDWKIAELKYKLMIDGEETDSI